MIMQNQSCLIFGIVVALFIQFRVAGLDKRLLETLSTKMKNSNKFDEEETSIILNTLDNISLDQTYKIEEFMNSGSGGAFFKIGIPIYDSSQPKGYTIKEYFTAKVIIDQDKDFTICNGESSIDKFNKPVPVTVMDLDNNEMTINERKISYLNVIKSINFFKGTGKKEPFYSCVLILGETSGDLSDTFFSDINDETKKGNSRRLFRFFARAALSLAELHFKAHILHGNISPYAFLVKSISKDNDIEPVLTDFRYILVNDSGEDIPDDQLRYNFYYRPPEMTGKTKEGILSDEKAWENNWKNYQFSKDFLEDVYALGKTIKKAFEFQKSYVSTSLCEYKALKKISDTMIEENVKKRPNMKAVLEMFIKETAECNKGVDNSLHIEFVTKARRSFPKRIVII